jgi:hypothetical protein
MWLLLLACAQDPLAAAGEAYAGQMKPMFMQNRALGEQFLQMASNVKRNEADAASVASTVSTTTLSAAETVATQAAKVRPADPQIASGHAALVSAWRHRADAYAAASKAWTAQDITAFDSAVVEVRKAAQEEAAAADQLAATLGPSGVQIDLYP